MPLSFSLSGKVIDSIVGGIVSNLLIKKRRNTLFFEDIMAEYIKKCEKRGYSSQIENMGVKWGALIVKQLVPPFMKKKPSFTVNRIMKEVWTSYGILDDLHLEKHDKIITLTTRNEGVTRVIGPNKLIPGAYRGVLNILFNSDLDVIDAYQKKELCEYRYKITDRPFNIYGRDRTEYLSLNAIPKKAKGYDIKNSIRTGIFTIKGNKIYFREKLLPIFEPTIFHIIGNTNLCLNELPPIAHKYFLKMIHRDSSSFEKLNLLKNLFQAMGLGIMNIVITTEGIIIEINYPPYGLQSERDNWNVISNVILGYVWMINMDFRILKTHEYNRKISIHITT